MKLAKRLTVVVGAGVLVGCALKGDVRRVERQLIDLQTQTARADSARAVSLNRILDELDVLQAAISDSLASQRGAIVALRGEMRTDLTEVQRQLVAIQELTGQSQARLTELRTQLEGRALTRVGVPTAGGLAAEEETGESAQELYDLGVFQLRQQSRETARMAFREVLDRFPDSPLAADAQYFVGETFEIDQPDSAAAAWEVVVELFPQSRRAPSALYKIGLLAEQAGDLPAARLHYNRVIVGYPDSDEAQLARAKLRNP